MSERRAMSQAPVLAVLVLLLGQFAIGMVVNLNVHIAANHPGARAGDYFSGSVHSVGWAIASGPVALATHSALGLFLVLAGAIVLARAIGTRRRRTVAAAALGTMFIVAAGFNGASFLDYNHNTNSLIMAWLFALATLSYIAVLALEAQH